MGWRFSYFAAPHRDTPRHVLDLCRLQASSYFSRRQLRIRKYWHSLFRRRKFLKEKGPRRGRLARAHDFFIDRIPIPSFVKQWVWLARRRKFAITRKSPSMAKKQRVRSTWSKWFRRGVTSTEFLKTVSNWRTSRFSTYGLFETRYQAPYQTRFEKTDTRQT